MSETLFHFIVLLTPNGEPVRVVAGPFMQPPSNDLMQLAHLMCESPVTNGWTILSVNTQEQNTRPGGQLYKFASAKSVMGELGITTRDTPFVCRRAALSGAL